MASGLFFSSPLHPTTNSWQQPPTSFLTPQPTSKFNWNGAFVPTSPSPLRTSKNANLMSSPSHGGKFLDEHIDIGLEPNIENAEVGVASKTNSTANQNFSSAFLTDSSTSTNPFADASSSSTSAFTPTTTPSFSLSSTTEPSPTSLNTFSSVSDRPTIFQFSSRAHSSSPAHLLQSHAKDNRESRKRIFLDRLRSRRDNARSDRTGDQVLRMDFIREKRQMEADMAKGWDQCLELDPDQDLEDDTEMSPVDEERDLLELADQWERMQKEAEGQQAEDGLDEDFDEFSDEGYDEAFMEVLSQEAGPQGLRQASVTGRDREHMNTTDTEMDMS